MSSDCSVLEEMNVVCCQFATVIHVRIAGDGRFRALLRTFATMRFSVFSIRIIFLKLRKKWRCLTSGKCE